MLAYLFSRYPVVSQTFCDSEMMALEGLGVPLAIGSLNPPPDSFRHPRLAGRKAPVFYPPPSKALESMRRAAEEDGSWAPLAELAAEHDAKYGESYKAATRARNALYFGRVFKEMGVSHVHVHFANRATHTALFMKRLGIPFSFTAHAQDFMVDLGSDELLAEMAREAEFVAGVSDFSSDLLRAKCPDSAGKITRVYNGLDLSSFPKAEVASAGEVLKIVSIGRLIEFKGFHHLIAACAQLKGRGVAFELTIVGDGPWDEQLKARAAELGVADGVRFAGVLGGDSIRELLAVSHVFALGAIIDSKGASDILPTVIAEAMASGLPVVSTRLAGIPEMVEHGSTGLLCEPGDESGLADALARMAAEPETRAAFGAAGMALAAQRFALDVTARQLLDLFPKSATAPASYPGMVFLAGSWGDRDQRSADPELRAAAASDGILPIALGLHADFRVSTTPPPTGLQFLPNEVVLNAAWDAAPERAKQALELNGDQRDARIAVYLAEFFERIGAKRLHAARSDVAEIAWLVSELIEIEASCCIEEGGANSRLLPEIEGPDLSIRQTRRNFGPFRFRIKPSPVTSEAAQAFIRQLLA
jgi:glycosyltransferase involved in cell wall biosynthesis